MQPSSTKKYEQPTRYLPSGSLKKVSAETCTEMGTEDQKRLQQSHLPLAVLTVEALEAHDAKHTTGPCELRQFACSVCHHSWWRNVLKSKPVSRCRGERCGNQRYTALPRDKQFGVGRFLCPDASCGRKFFGYCEATDRLQCRQCGAYAKPYIHPRWRKRRRSLNPQAGVFRPQAGVFQPQAGVFRPQAGPDDLRPQFGRRRVADREMVHSAGGRTSFPSFSGENLSQSSYSLSQSSYSSLASSTSTASGSNRRRPRQPRIRSRPRRRIFNSSQVHQPTGGTMSTFLTQIDFEKEGEEVVLDYDSDDDEEKVGACKFECAVCGNEYTVICRMIDTATCYNCREENRPLSWAPPRDIQSESDNTHSCSRCNGKGDCPNLHAVGL